MLRALVLVLAATAQMPAQAPAYEVASIRLNTAGGSGTSSTQGSPGQIVFTNTTLKYLIERAYNVKPFEVAGPAWIDSVAFDIAAKYPSGSNEEDRKLMLRTLLEERFHLAMHRETKPVPGYALVMAKAGFRLQPAEPGENNIRIENGRVKLLRATGISMSGLADTLARNIDEVVVDRTGVNGVYNLELRWTKGDSDEAPSIFTALEETLGLRLQAEKIPIGIVVIDRIDRTPTEN